MPNPLKRTISAETENNNCERKKTAENIGTHNSVIDASSRGGYWILVNGVPYVQNQKNLRRRKINSGEANIHFKSIHVAESGDVLAISEKDNLYVYDKYSDIFTEHPISKPNKIIDEDTGQEDYERISFGQVVTGGFSEDKPLIWFITKNDRNDERNKNIYYLNPDKTINYIRIKNNIRLIAVGEDDIPIVIDSEGNLLKIERDNNERHTIKIIKQNVGNNIVHLDMVNIDQIWGLTECGKLNMWKQEEDGGSFIDVPLESSFWINANDGVDNTVAWEDFSLTSNGTFIGKEIGTKEEFITFNTRNISRLRNQHENPSNISLHNSNTRDDAKRKLGDDYLIYNMNGNLNVAYNQTNTNQNWDGSSTIPNAISGSNIVLANNPINPLIENIRQPELEIYWNNELDPTSSQYHSDGYISPFGGLVFTEASLQQTSNNVENSIRQNQILYNSKRNNNYGFGLNQIVPINDYKLEQTKRTIALGGEVEKESDSPYFYEKESVSTSTSFSFTIPKQIMKGLQSDQDKNDNKKDGGYVAWGQLFNIQIKGDLGGVVSYLNETLGNVFAWGQNTVNLIDVTVEWKKRLIY